MWQDTQNNQVVRTFSEARAARPNWSAPENLTDEMLLDQGFMPIAQTASGVNPNTQNAVELPPVLINGVWTQAWRLEDMPPGQLDTNLAAAKDNGIAQTYVDVNTVYDLAIGRRATEYSEAETAARAFIADQTQPASGYVTGFAQDNPTGQVQTNLWSAQQIIGRADAFRNAQLSMRNKRFTSQAAMRSAADYAALVVVVKDWNTFIAGLRQQLGI